MAVPFTPVSAKQAAINIANKMGFVRQGLMSRGEYLCDPTVPERVVWEPYGRGQRLVILPPSSASPNTREATPFPDTPDSAAATNPPDDTPSNPDSTPDSTPLPANDVPAEPAVLAIVTQLVPGQSWIYPDGRWTGRTKYVKQFTDLKLLCTGGAATHPRFASDYATAITNLNLIMGKIEDPRNDRNTILSGPANHIRVRHPLFTEYGDADAVDPADVAYTRAWPTSTPEAAEALEVAAETHRVEPLPAYDLNGVLIEPQYYTKRLDGATVILRFELTHHLIGRGKEKPPVDTFSARVVQIRIILPPPGAAPATPRKKKLLPHDTYFGSFTPTKRNWDDDEDEKENERPKKTIRRVAQLQLTIS